MKWSLAFALLFQVCLNLYSQSPVAKIIPPSPEASALAKYGNMPVSFYTGVQQVSIPIYTVQSGDIQVPITLSYHASGIRVDEEGS